MIAPPVADQISMEAAAPIQPTTAAQPPVAQPVTLAAVPEPLPAPKTKEETRMMERRALPIKDSTAVLGSNWRDEVIAKAVGGSAPEEESLQGEFDDEAEDAGAKLGDGLQILLAEDNAINALLTRTLLEAEGAIVDTVEDGALALDAVSKKKYDLIFMDMRMPNMDGLEATRKIRAYGSTMPIIALTANAFDDDRNACFDSGMNDFMTKPVSAEELSEMVITWTKEGEAKKLAS
ncbi:MAG: response regulator [Robiginitomaculum sp.]|nr:response regulator [Robiginitomaculum sp.]